MSFRKPYMYRYHWYLCSSHYSSPEESPRPPSEPPPPLPASSPPPGVTYDQHDLPFDSNCVPYMYYHGDLFQANTQARRGRQCTRTAGSNPQPAQLVLLCRPYQLVRCEPTPVVSQPILLIRLPASLRVRPACQRPTCLTHLRQRLTCWMPSSRAGRPRRRTWPTRARGSRWG